MSLGMRHPVNGRTRGGEQRRSGAVLSYREGRSVLLPGPAQPPGR
jgi:hypothetical protein